MVKRKIKMEMVQNRTDRNVTFSKRRLGLFKKASELAAKCNAEVGIVRFSPGGNPHCFGNPSLDVIVERFKNENEGCQSNNIDEVSRVELEELYKDLNSITENINEEKKQGEEYQNLLESGGEKSVEKSIEELTFEELKENKGKLVEMYGMLRCNIDRMQAATSLMLLSKDKGPWK